MSSAPDDGSDAGDRDPRRLGELVKTWEFWRRQMRESGRCREGCEAGVWALDIVERHLGRGWLEETLSGEGQLPWEICYGPTHTVAFGDLLQLAVSLESCEDAPGFAKVRSSLQADHRSESRMHSIVQLGVAAGLRSLGADVSLERRSHRSRSPIDVVGRLHNVNLAVETFVILVDEKMRASEAVREAQSNALMQFTWKYGVLFDGSIGDAFTDEDLPSLIEAVDATARSVASDGQSRDVDHPASNLKVLSRGSQSGTVYELPSGSGKGWERTEGLLRKKAKQSIGSGATWLRADVHDGMWQQTPWSQFRLASKTDELAGAVRSALSETVDICGVVLTSGAASAIQGGLFGETTWPRSRQSGLRRDLGALRVRETIIIPLEDGAGEEAGCWYDVYDGERDWLDTALVAAGWLPLSSLISLAS